MHSAYTYTVRRLDHGSAVYMSHDIPDGGVAHNNCKVLP